MDLLTSLVCACLVTFSAGFASRPTTSLRFSESQSAAHVGSTGNSFAVGAADIDHDGDVDLFVTNSGSNNALYVNDGKASFTDGTAAAGLVDGGSSRGVTFADVNGDGHVDLYVGDSGSANHLYINDGFGHFMDGTAAAGVGDRGFSQGQSFGDVDGDGDLDLFIANFGNSNTLYINDGRGTFSNGTVAAGLGGLDGVNSFGCAMADIDGDGDLDLYVTNDGSLNNLYINGGHGVFTDGTAAAGVAATADRNRATSFGDVDGDGDLDIYLVSALASNQLFINDGRGKFTDRAKAAGVDDSHASQGTNMADVDGDGDLDIVVTQIFPGGDLTLYLNNGEGKFENKASEANVNSWIFGQGAIFADFNGDDAVDMYVDSWGTPPIGTPSQANKLFLNKGGAPARWLSVRPVDRAGHATLLGAHVQVFEAGTRTRVGGGLKVVDGGSGFCSQNSYDVFFGLEGSAAAFDVQVRSPGGSWVTKAGVLPNALVEVKVSV